jgi:hypothetical protein
MAVDSTTIAANVGGAATTPATTGGSTGTPPAYSTQTPTATTTVPSLQSLETTNPGAGTYAASLGTASTVGTAPTANASLTGQIAGISNNQINPNDATNAASQLDAITNANSPYIQQAEQQGLLSAASRGLENSSIGAGASEAAAVQAAAPLAEQNAAGATSGLLQNSQLATQANEFNASQANANQQLNAQLQTQQAQFNASQQQSAAATNTAAQNAMTQQTMQLNEALNQQYLSGSQAQSLASIQGNYNELIAANSSASSMYQSYLNSMGALMNNQNIAPSRVADSVSAEQSMLESGLGVIDALNGGSSTNLKGAAAATNLSVTNNNQDFAVSPTTAAAPVAATPAKAATTPAAGGTTAPGTLTTNTVTNAGTVPGGQIIGPATTTPREGGGLGNTGII